MKKLAFLSWALLALLMVGCSEDNDNKELELPEFELIEMGDHHLFPNTPSCSYGNFGLVFYNGNEFCTFVSNDIEEEYTAEEIFELADEIKPTGAIRICGVSNTESILRTYKQQRFWAAVRNDDGYAVKSAIVEESTMPWFSITGAIGNTSHYNFDGYPYNKYGNYCLAFNHHCKEYAVFVCELNNATGQDVEYTAEEIFELADEIHQAIPMCACGISTTLSIPRLDTKHQKIWVAVRNEKHCIEKNFILDSSESIIYPYPPIEPPVEEIEM